MNDTNLLEMLKVDLGISTQAYDTRLAQIITAAKKAIALEGITLDLTDFEDCGLVIIYAAWIWRKRDSGEGMPRMLRYKLNNRLFHEKES